MDLLPLHDSPPAAKEAGLEAFSAATRLRQVTQFAQPLERLEQAVSDANSMIAAGQAIRSALKSRIAEIKLSDRAKGVKVRAA